MPVILRLPQMRAERGSTVAVPVTLDTTGGEAGLGFSVHYQVLGLANPRVELGPDASGWTLTINANQTGQGRIGVLMDTDPQAPLSGGMKHMATITFDVLPNALDANGLEFANTPISLSTADYMANNVATLYQNGDVLIGNAAAPSRPIQPLGYFGSYNPSPVINPPNTDPLQNEPVINLPGTTPGTPVNPTHTEPNATIFGMSPLMVAGIAAVGLYIWSES